MPICKHIIGRKVRTTVIRCACLALLCLATTYNMFGQSAQTINPSGGASASFNDGLKVVVNTTGKLAVYRANKTQYCCGSVYPAGSTGGVNLTFRFDNGTTYNATGSAFTACSTTPALQVGNVWTTSMSGYTSSTISGKKFFVTINFKYIYPSKYFLLDYYVRAPSDLVTPETVHLYLDHDTYIKGDDRSVGYRSSNTTGEFVGNYRTTANGTTGVSSSHGFKTKDGFRSFYTGAYGARSTINTSTLKLSNTLSTTYVDDGVAVEFVIGPLSAGMTGAKQILYGYGEYTSDFTGVVVEDPEVPSEMQTPVTLGFTSASYVEDEGNDSHAANAIMLTVSNGVLRTDQPASFTVSGGTAVNGTDYTYVKGFIIPAGDYTTPRNLILNNITILGNSTVQANRTFNISIDNNGCNDLLVSGPITTATYTILDDDKLPLEFSKQQTVGASKSQARLLDTITYTLQYKLTSAVSPNPSVLIFDPIPLNTEYIAGSATAGGVLSTITQRGKSLPAIVWPGKTLVVGQTNTVSFKVVVMDIPQNTASTIDNAGFATYAVHTRIDTLSTADLCEVTVTEVEPLKAEANYMAMMPNTQIDNFVIAINDTDPYRQLVSSSIVVPPLHGIASLNSNGSLNYTPNTDFVGVDSLSYQIKTPQDSARAKVYSVVMEPSSNNYMACVGATVNLNMKPIAGISYYWYTTATGGTANPLTPANSKNVVKDSQAQQSVWVEPVFQGVVMARIRIDIGMASSCGETNPTDDCTLHGTIIWREDFDSYADGNNPLSANFAPTGLPVGRTTYNYFAGPTGMPNDGQYSLVKRAAHVTWLTTDDHTSPKNNQIGRFMQVNATYAPGVFYKHLMEDLCPGLRLSFHAWVANASNLALRPNLIFFLVNPVNSDTIASFHTGNIPGAVATDWRRWGFEFEVPDGISSIQLVIRNNNPGGSGNDLGLDDITIRLCSPPINVNPSSPAACEGSQVVFSGSYDETASPVFGNPLTYRWEFSKDATTWQELAGSQQTVTASSINSLYTIPSVDTSHTGYYRMLVSRAGDIDRINCRAAGMNQFRTMAPPDAYPDIRIQLCTMPNRQINLSSYLDTVEFKQVVWERVSMNSPDFAAGTTTTTGQLASGLFEQGSHIYRYTLENNCYTASARMYVSTISKPFSEADSVVICKDQLISNAVQLNQILGLEANGIWTYNAALIPFVKKVVAPSKFAGSCVFDAKGAWLGITDPAYLYAGGYKGDMQAKRFEFTYTTTAGSSCLGNSIHKLIVIVTSVLF